MISRETSWRLIQNPLKLTIYHQVVLKYRTLSTTEEYHLLQEEDLPVEESVKNWQGHTWCQQNPVVKTDGTVMRVKVKCIKKVKVKRKGTRRILTRWQIRRKGWTHIETSTHTSEAAPLTITQNAFVMTVIPAVEKKTNIGHHSPRRYQLTSMLLWTNVRLAKNASLARSSLLLKELLSDVFLVPEEMSHRIGVCQHRCLLP